MIINKSLSIYKNNRSEDARTSKNETPIIKPTDKNVSISSAGENAEKNWQAIAKKYDTTSITDNERASMVTELSEKKLISSEQAMVMVAPLSINHNPEQKVNFLQIQKQNLEFSQNKGIPNKKIDLLQSVIGILENINDMKSSQSHT